MSASSTLHAALLHISPAKLVEIGATNITQVSARTIRFDLPDGKGKDGVNRVKITAREDGTLDVRLIEMVERDLIGGVAAAALPGLLLNAVGIDVAAK